MFNHEARWDRELPAEAPCANGAPISVTCLMKQGKVIPRSFVWRNHSYNVEKIYFTWKNKNLSLYSVQTKSGTYEISLDLASLTWHLRRLAGP